MNNEELIFEKRGALGLITLNRPKALNALTLNMVEIFHLALNDFFTDDSIKHIAVRSSGGKAFCAGGDIRQVYNYAKEKRFDEAIKFLEQEYALNARIFHSPKPYISLINGIVMGGGVGISLHGTHRLAGSDYILAMPEVAIGFFPDVGVNYTFTHLPDNYGMYLSLTGTRISRADALHLKLATHSVRANSEDNIIEALSSGENIDCAVEKFRDEIDISKLETKKSIISDCFGQKSLSSIISKLNEAAKKDDFAKETLSDMQKRSPTSMAITFEQMRRGKSLSFEEAISMDLEIAEHIIKENDFYEGIRAQLVDKDYSPNWHPPTIDDIDENHIKSYFHKYKK